MLLLLLVAMPLSLVASVPPAPAKISGSVNTILLATLQRCLLAYQLTHPLFAPVDLVLNSGLAGGLAAASSGNFDFTIMSNSVSNHR